MSNEFKITAEGWPGIFLTEEEAALALAGRPLPERILEHHDVSLNVRYRAASEPEYRAEILSSSTRFVIARWSINSMGQEEADPSVQVELRRTPIMEFRTSAGGRSYSMDDTHGLIDALQIAARLAMAAEFHIKNRKLAERIVNR